MNIAHRLTEQALLTPYKRAVVARAGKDERGRTTYAQLTFRELDRESDRLAHGLSAAGIGKGVRTVLMTPPSLDFFTITFALFKVGAVPVMVDPGMGVQRMVACLQKSAPEAFIGIPKAHAMRRLYPSYFKTVRVFVTVGSRWFWGGHTLTQLLERPWSAFEMAETAETDPAAILFTTGSTGPAKGAVYTHANFNAQVNAIRDHFEIAKDEIDLPTFPLFALFDPALGMTAVIPDMDPTRPAKANPAGIIDTISDHGVTNMFASPALLRNLQRYGNQKEIRLSSLRRVVSAGAPVSPDVVSGLSKMLPESAKIHTPYGATEAMPVTSIEGKEILEETEKWTRAGYGVCVGKPLAGIEARVIEISDEPIEAWSDNLKVEELAIGEIAVSGPVVTGGYFENPDQDRLMKIGDGGRFWHRMGDLGWEDQKGRLWFCGRKSHRVTTDAGELYTIPCEAVFNNHPAVYRSALVGVGRPGKQWPVMCVELEPDQLNVDGRELIRELLATAAENPITQTIRTVLVHPGFPTDIRHNAKIFREELALWATEIMEEKGKKRHRR